MPLAGWTPEDEEAARAYLAGEQAPPEVPDDVLELYGYAPAPPPREAGRLAQASPFEGRPYATATPRSELDVPVLNPLLGASNPTVAEPTSTLEPYQIPTTAEDRERVRQQRLAAQPRMITAEMAAAPAAPGAPPAPMGGIIAQDILRQRMAPRPVSVRQIPEADILERFRVERQAPLSPEARAMLMGGVEAQQAANIEAAEVQRRQALDQALQHRLASEDAAQQLGRFQAREQQRQLAWEQQLEKVENLRRGAREIDPDRVWEGRTGARVLSIIGMALGEMGRAYVGGENLAAKLVRQAVDDDIMAQRVAIEQYGESAAAAETLLGAMRQNMMSPESAEQMARVYSLEMAQQQLASQAAAAGGPLAVANAGQLNAALEAEKGKLLADIERAEKGALEEQFRHQEAKRIVSGGGGMDPVRAFKLYQQLYPKATFEDFVQTMARGTAPVPGVAGPQTREELMRAKEETQLRVRLPDGRVGFATQSTIAKEVQYQLDAIAQLRGNFAKMRRIIDEAGVRGWGTARAELQTLAQSNIALAKEAERLGAITKADQELVTPLTGLAAGEVVSFDPNTVAALKEGESHFVQREKAAVKNLSAEPWRDVPLEQTQAELED